MKKHLKTLATAMLCLAMALLVSCKKDNTEPSGGSTQTVATVTTNDVTEITKTTAVCGGEVTSENGWAVTQRGVCWGTNHNPTLSDSYTEDGDGIGKFTSTITGLTADTKYYVRAYAKNAAGTSFGPEKSFTTLSGGGSGGGGFIGSHEYVDLGLPSGTLWATCNVAKDSPYGDLFAWGEVMTKSDYNYDNYIWYDSEHNLTKYNDVDNKTILDLEDDVANVKWGGSWRMPTKSEFEELVDECTWTWTKQDGYDGYLVEGKNGMSIFMPCNNNEYCWSSSLGDNCVNAYFLYFDHSGQIFVEDQAPRWPGFLVRPVSSPQN